MFKLLNSNRYYLPNTDNRFLHLATVHHSVREYICFADTKTQNIYIEEITRGILQWISDDKLVESNSSFLTEKNGLDISKPLLEDKDWLHRTP